jgi:hypothetical protein
MQQERNLCHKPTPHFTLLVAWLGLQVQCLCTVVQGRKEVDIAASIHKVTDTSAGA